MAQLQFSEGVYFVSSGAELTQSLFTGPRTAAGTFELRKRGVLLRDPKGLARVYLCANDPASPFLVSCSQVTDKNGRRRIAYMQALRSLDELWLGIRGCSFAEERGLASRLWAAAAAL